MKKVAATRGHRVNFADFLGEAIAREGNWAGRDKVLNFLSRPPSAILALSQQPTRSEFAKCRIRLFLCDARKICTPSKIISEMAKRLRRRKSEISLARGANKPRKLGDEKKEEAVASSPNPDCFIEE
jgi:hypothetical protein